MFNLPFFNQKRKAANQKDAVDGGVKMIGFLAACAFSFSMLLITALSYESIYENQSEIVALFLSLPSGLFKAFLILLAFLSFVALVASVTAIKWQRAKSEAFALAKVQEAQVIKADQAADSTEQMVKLFAAMAALNQGGKTDSKLLEALQGLQTPQLTAPQITVQDMDHDLAEIINQEECLLIHGPKGSGKTTVLHHLVYRRLYQLAHEVVILDPHTTPIKWYEAEVFGGGRDYETIFQSIETFEQLMTTRYAELASGKVDEGGHHPITLVIDEYRSIVKALSRNEYKKRFSLDAIPALLTEGRKVNLWVALVSHSTSVKALGLEGEGDLREGFVFLHLTREKDGSKSATASYNGEAHLPTKLLGAAPKSRLSRVDQSGQSVRPVHTTKIFGQTSRPKTEDQKKGSVLPKKISKQTEDYTQEDIQDQVGKWQLAGWDDEKIIFHLLTGGYKKTLVSGNKMRKYLKRDRNYFLPLVAKVRRELQEKRNETIIHSSNGHLNGHHA